MRPRVALALAMLFAVGWWLSGASWFAFGLGFACSDLLGCLAAWWHRKDAEIMERWQLFEERDQ